ncbi:urease accessory protein UreD [Kaistia geumhonensis]|uniref:Urease accessory protein UreD n=1 Tax=Kaistia geumhonensis TaxID=410839 RepID=A0ABU0M8W0_9HYPH|nr:urease accessory protein UreD [Kaistia geumhonensis]MCX5477594.1 urease accessory protein UreD [Kaistia geumhonensis]MDQ0517198.1 urease accessory protein [Kaistia geumhonensis]
MDGETIPAGRRPEPDAAPVRMQRAEGRARIGFRRDGPHVRLTEFVQQGCCKIRLPRPEPGVPPDAVLLNTAGGITSGDVLVYEAAIGDGVDATVTTQAAERIYRAVPGAAPARVENRVSIGAGAHIDWLPQETILFDRSAISRSLEVDLAADATALLLEAYVFGRTAMGERATALTLADRWRVRRAGTLVYADGIAVDGDVAALMERGATAGGQVAIASLVLVAPDAEDKLGAVRERLETCMGEAGASAFRGLLSLRFLAPSGQVLRRDLESVILALRGRPMPRVWSC